MTKHRKKILTTWLLTGFILVTAMILIGAITRLTGSGLSMVEWKLIGGAIPPLNEQEWYAAFEKYQQYPEFQKKNIHFSLQDFQSIFWWEYIHRLLGRMIGIIFIVPFAFFLLKYKLPSKLIRNLWILFGLGSLQALFGWLMVKSGMIENPYVSHYRLAIHLITGFMLAGYILLLVLGLNSSQNESTGSRLLKSMLLGSLVLFCLQLTYGAFTAGLKAGYLYNSFPKMGDQWIAGSVGFAFEKHGIISLFENPASVQFIHRLAGSLLLILILFMWIISRRQNVPQQVKQSISLYTMAGVIQFIIGILTLITAVPLILGVVHQVWAVIMLGTLIYALYKSGTLRWHVIPGQMKNLSIT